MRLHPLLTAQQAKPRASSGSDAANSTKAVPFRSTLAAAAAAAGLLLQYGGPAAAAPGDSVPPPTAPTAASALRTGGSRATALQLVNAPAAGAAEVTPPASAAASTGGGGAAVGGAVAGDPPLPLPDTFPPLPPLQLPPYTEEVLPNGLRLFLLPDREVPLVRGLLLTRGGQVAAPQGQVGVAGITASVQRAGGSVAHPGAVLDERLEDLAAVLEASAGQQSQAFSLQCLPEDTPEVLRLLAELLTQPAFPADRLAVAVAQALDAISHRYDSAGATARREVAKLVYGRDSPYARQPTRAEVAALRPEDLRAFADAWVRPDAALLGLVGDFEPGAAARAAREALGGWAPAAGQPDAPPALPAPSMPPRQEGAGRLYLVDRPGLSQASVAVAEPGIRLSDPDAAALEVLGSTFNSFGGTVFDQLRSKEGLAYTVSAGWDTPVGHEGVFIAAADTSAPAQLLAALRRVLAEATQSAPPAEALAAAQAQSLNSFVFNFGSAAAQMQRILAYTLLGLPQDFLFTFLAKSQAVGAADVLAAAQRHLHPEAQVAVVVGDAAAVAPELRAAGWEVQPLQLDMR